jgi:glycosyltransferase involved in cell wall biosynthesis
LQWGAGVLASSPLTVLAFLEAETMTGPAVNLFGFHQAAAALWLDAQGRPAVRTVLAVFEGGSHPAPSQSVLRAAAETIGLPVVAVLERFRFDPGVVVSIRRVIERVNPDVVQTHSVKSHTLIRLARVTPARPWVAFHHGYTSPDWKMKVYNQFDRWSLRQADLVITPTRAFVPALTRVGVDGDRITVVHNALDVTRTSAAAERSGIRASLGLRDDEQVVVCIGRLSREKGHRDLIEAMSLLRTQRRDAPARLVVVGDGPERADLRAVADRTGIGESIVWLGQVANAHRFYAAADAAVLPSHSEGSPNALLEAAAYALPIVATAVGGVPEILVNGVSGRLVPPHHPEALAAALFEVLADRSAALRLGRNARAAIETRHDPAARARALVHIYRSLAARRAVPSCAEEDLCAS